MLQPVHTLGSGFLATRAAYHSRPCLGESEAALSYDSTRLCLSWGPAKDCQIFCLQRVVW